MELRREIAKDREKRNRRDDQRNSARQDRPLAGPTRDLAAGNALACPRGESSNAPFGRT